MPLQRSIIQVCHALLRFAHKGLACSAKDSRQRPLLHHVLLGENTMPIPHSAEQDALPIVFLISKQGIPYQTHEGTCFVGVSTPKIWSLAYLSNHIP
jgi:hypothetical protein